MLARVHSIADPAQVADPTYADGLRAAIPTALDYGLTCFGSREDRTPPVPRTLRAQARLAARNGVGLDTVLRRYHAGYTVLSDFLISEAASDRSLEGDELKGLLRALANRVDRLLVEVSREHGSESERHPSDSIELRRVECVRRLLAGDPVESSGLAYRLDGHHLGLVVKGTLAPNALSDLAVSFDYRLLAVRPEDGAVWAWLGGRRPPDPVNLISRLNSHAAPSTTLALGEPAEGPDGWRLSHRQATAAERVAQRGGEQVVRYADVALLASALDDDLLATSLRRLYLEPLEAQRDGGKKLRQTLRAYFAAQCNVSAAAAALRVSRQTVNNRLRAIEMRLGRSVDGCAAELQVALRLDGGDVLANPNV